MPNLARTIEQRAQSANSLLKETHQKYLKKISDTVQLLHQDHTRIKIKMVSARYKENGDKSNR